MTIGIDTSFLVCLETEGHRFEESCRELLSRFIQDAERLALSPSILSEFVHTVTDPRRVASPLTVEEALDRAWEWWTVDGMMHVFPNQRSTELFVVWMHQHRLGRKRLNDTLLAAAYWTAGIRRLVTLNAADFRVFGCFELIVPPPAASPV